MTVIPEALLTPIAGASDLDFSNPKLSKVVSAANKLINNPDEKVEVPGYAERDVAKENAKSDLQNKVNELEQAIGKQTDNLTEEQKSAAE